ncbi:uncharacterized protein LOC122513552 [Polistes fuscatus]|uniref:uncharacterized protein LOC122513552 n=1 Tax=Polistes fuscatus TaxID=30207 RepID=UPI001CA97035|nr:uncharacterized protein LOC122513552 [Polistes fuscatus]
MVKIDFTKYVVFGLEILQFSVLLKTLEDKIECILYVTGTAFTVYINFYLGQRLLNHSDAVREELCDVPFYTLSIHTQKLLLLIIARSGKPCFLSIGNMFVSSHQVFAGLMRKALSFAMVYKSVP